MFQIKYVLEKEKIARYSTSTETLVSDTSVKQLILSIILSLYIISIVKLIKIMYIF